ncbi:hypothetical protein ACN38_g12752 [Penicillium nordicum]|uniref:Uncharacterized protein n=1 Tax=Penicillium nordicum TaxID=229535 RepID=A0A0M8NY17_9EURO|nr:hypothetical protein ACN38_g12752 [Penicillium nordicum]
MKTAIALVGLVALTPSALALGKCHYGQRYCGSWLVSHDGYAESDLQNAHHGPNVEPYPPPNGGWKSSAYLCLRNNLLEFTEYCYEGCHETGGSGEDDYCELGN